MATKPVTFNVSSFIKGNEGAKDHTIIQELPATSGADRVVKAKTVKEKKKSSSEDTEVVIPQATTSMSYIQDNIPYANSYTETNRQLNDAIQELTILERDVLGDIAMVRSSKTLKNKFNYLNDMTGNAVNIINTKLSAIKEINKTTNDIHNLEIRRVKELKLSMSQEDDNTRLANLYNAFVSTPIGVGPGMLGPGAQDLMVAGGGQDISRYAIGDMNDANWESSLDPSNRRMVLDAKGVLETIVIYDEATGDRRFAAIDKNTGAEIPGVETPDNSTIYELDINVRGGFAKDSNRNVIYPLRVINSVGANSIGEY